MAAPLVGRAWYRLVGRCETVRAATDFYPGADRWGQGAGAIADVLTARQVRPSIGALVYAPTDPVGRLRFNVLAMVAESESDLIRLRTRVGMNVARARRPFAVSQALAQRTAGGALVNLLAAGERSTDELDELFGVGRFPGPELPNRPRAERVPHVRR